MSRVSSALAGLAAAWASGAAFAIPAQQALDPMGPQAARIDALWHLMLAMCAVVFVVVVAAAWLAVLRRRRATLDPPLREDTPEQQRRLTRVVGAAVVVSGLGLAVLVIASIGTDRALARLPHDDALHIDLIGHQWWWEAVYDDADASKVFSTANELHIPVGRPVIFTLKADDVIHSFWVPNLHGKKDLIPGRTATHLLRADQPGIYRGQCAEFCGYQHAWMGLLVIADPPAQYDSWVAQQRSPAPEPTDDETAKGRAVFESGTCAMCHTIEGTHANAKRAPDLTHVASRMTLAAVALDNTPANRAAWILDPQRFKPGCNMPANPLPPAELAALLRYLDTLK